MFHWDVVVSQACWKPCAVVRRMAGSRLRQRPQPFASKWGMASMLWTFSVCVFFFFSKHTYTYIYTHDIIIMLCHIISYYTMLYYVMLVYVMLYYIILCYVILHYITSYYIILHYIIWFIYTYIYVYIYVDISSGKIEEEGSEEEKHK